MMQSNHRHLRCRKANVKRHTLWLLSTHAPPSWCRSTSLSFCSPLFWISHTHEHGKCSILWVLLTQCIL